MIYSLSDVLENGKIDYSKLHATEKTKYLCVTGQDGSGKTSLRDNLAKYYSDKGELVITSKSPCDPHLVDLLNNAISQKGYEDPYTEQLLFSFCDGLLSNYMHSLNYHCDYFICQRGPLDQYAHGSIRSKLGFEEIHDIQRPNRLMKFSAYIHLNCRADVAWRRVFDDPYKDRYEFPEYFKQQVQNTKKVFEEVQKENPFLSFAKDAEHFYLDTTELSIENVFNSVVKYLEKINF